MVRQPSHLPTYAVPTGRHDYVMVLCHNALWTVGKYELVFLCSVCRHQVQDGTADDAVLKG